MTLPTPTPPLNDRVVALRHANVSSAVTYNLVSPWRGTILSAWAVLESTTQLLVADAVLTLKRNGTSFGTTLTITASGTSAATNTTFSNLTLSQFVEVGDSLSATSNGASSGNNAAQIIFVIRQ